MEKFERSTQRPATLDDVAAQLSELMLAIERLTEAVVRREPLVDVKTAAEHIGVSTRTLHRMVADELVPYRRFGRTLRFPLAAFGPPLLEAPRGADVAPSMWPWWRRGTTRARLRSGQEESLRGIAAAVTLW
jgi:excisionase family DNA binding protein